MRKPGGKKVRPRKPAVSVRLPLPKKGEARHGDATKYDRQKEKERVRRLIRAPEGPE